jgi:hypothetical protein
VRSVHAIGKIARGLGYAYVRFLHNLIIRLSDFLRMSSICFRDDDEIREKPHPENEAVKKPSEFQSCKIRSLP